MLVASASNVLPVLAATSGIVVALISGGVALRAGRVARTSAESLTLLKDNLDTERARHDKLFDRQLSADDLLKKYSEPLAGAAFDLQSRCYNIVCKGLFQRFGAHHQRFPDAVMTTLFRFAQYFGWSEILRREIQYLSFQKEGVTKSASELMGDIAAAVASSDHDESLMIWVDEQRAIGERMIVEHPNGPRCMGYAAFCDKYDECFAQLFERVALDVAAPASMHRLGKAQNKLCDLVVQLDGEGRRYNKDRMERVPDAEST